MIELFFNTLFGDLAQSTGSWAVVCMVIMALITAGLLFLGMEFDFALLCVSPLPYAFYKAGYLPIWISGLFILIPIAIGIYLVYMRFLNK